MANFPILQEVKGEWRSTKTVEIMGLRIPAHFTDDPRLLYDYIVLQDEIRRRVCRQLSESRSVY